jgi:hypothetical protein
MFRNSGRTMKWTHQREETVCPTSHPKLTQPISFLFSKLQERQGKEHTPNTKAKKDDESLQKYREWKEQQKKKTLETAIAEKKQKLKKDREEEATAVASTLEKAETPTKVDPVDPLFDKEISFSTSASAHFLTAMMNGEAAISPIKTEEASGAVTR